MHKRVGACFFAVALAAVSTSISISPAIAAPSCRGFTGTKIGTNGRDVLKGTAGRDVIMGLGGDDDLIGFEGNDVLCGGPGDDLLLSSFGDDINLGGPGDFDLILAYQGRDLVDGGPGRWDAAAFAWADRGVRADLAKGRSSGPTEGKDALRGIERFFGSEHRDVLLGSRRKDVFFGYAGNDVLRGKGGEDVLFGESGSDRVDGGKGIDMAQFFYDPTGVKVDLAARKAWAIGTSDVDRLRSMEAAQGSENGDNKLYGDGKRNFLYSTGEETKDQLFGRGGNDRLAPAPYKDSSLVFVRGGGGRDEIIAPRAEVYGDEGDDFIVARTGHGGAGDDTIKAKVGHGDDGNDIVKAATPFGGPGKDMLRASLFAQGEGGNDLILGSGAGGEGDDVFSEGRRYFGGSGKDIMHATGSRHLFGHEPGATTAPPLEDIDVVSYTGSKKAVTVDLAAGTGKRAGEPEASTDTFAYPSFQVVGSRHNDTLSGHVGDDVLFGWKGQDTLAGLEGGDLLKGGTQNDSGDGGLGIDFCPQVEERTFCEDELQEVPIPPLALPAGLGALVDPFRTELRKLSNVMRIVPDPLPFRRDGARTAERRGLLRAP